MPVLQPRLKVADRIRFRSVCHDMHRNELHHGKNREKLVFYKKYCLVLNKKINNKVVFIRCKMISLLNIANIILVTVRKVRIRKIHHPFATFTDGEPKFFQLQTIRLFT